MVKTIVNNKNNTTKISIRKALIYSGCSKNMYQEKKDRRYAIATAGTVATAATAVVTPSTTTMMIEQEIQKISLQRPTYGTRRVAAMLTRILGIPVNRKKVQRIFRKIGYITPSRRKEEIFRSKIPNVKANRPNQIW